MALIALGNDDSEEEPRPWELQSAFETFNNPKRIAKWEMFRRESIIQRAELGIPLSIEEQEILNELRRQDQQVSHALDANVHAEEVVEETAPAPPIKPPKRRRRKKSDIPILKQARDYLKDERGLFE